MFRSLVYVSSVSVLFPLVFALIRIRYLDKVLKILLVYLFASLTIEVFATFWAFVLHRSNHFMINTFTVTECILISFMYHQVFVSTLLKRIVPTVIATFTVFSITLFILKSFFVFNSTISTVACLLVSTWVFAYFYQILQQLQYQTLFQVPMFWISVGCSFYFSGNLFLFLYGEIILNEKSKMLYANLWLIYYTLLFIFRILLAVGLWFSKTHLQSSLLSRQEQQ